MLFQRNLFIAAALNEAIDKAGSKFFHAHLRILHHVDQFMEEQRVREILMRNNHVHEGDRRHTGEVGQIADAHHFGHGIHGRVGHARAAQNAEPRVVQNLGREEGLHRIALGFCQRHGLRRILLSAAADVVLNHGGQLRDHCGREFGKVHEEIGKWVIW